MDQHQRYTLDAECGCSLTACEEGLIVSERPGLHLRTSLRPKIERIYSNKDVRLGFIRMLDPEEHWPGEEQLAFGGANMGLPDEWKALIRGAVRKDPHMDCEEKKKFYEALALGVPSLEEQSAWFVYLAYAFRASSGT